MIDEFNPTGFQTAVPVRPQVSRRAGRMVSLLALLGFSLGFAGIRASGPAPAPDLSRLPPAVARSVDFTRDVLPIFQSNCFKCHGPEKQRSGFRLDRRDSALKSGDAHAPNIKPGHSAESPLIHLVAGVLAELRMPEKGEPLSAE